MATPRTRQATTNVPVGDLLGEEGRVLLSRGLCLIKTQMKSSLPQKPTYPTKPAQPYIPYTHRRLPAQQTTKKSSPEAPRLWGAFFISPPRTKTVSPSPPQDQNSQDSHHPFPPGDEGQPALGSQPTATFPTPRKKGMGAAPATVCCYIRSLQNLKSRRIAHRLSQLPCREKREWAPRFLAFAVTFIPFRVKN
jgi:hypothetical protein